MKRDINYIGWVGYNNLGDEALFDINKRFFAKFNLISRHKLYDTSITLFGGGTLFPEWPFGAQINKYNYAFGVGVKDPSLWGYPKQHYIEAMKRCNFRDLSVRGYVSQKILKKYGISARVVGDPALSLEPHKYKRINKKKIIINIGVPAKKMWGDSPDHVLHETIELCKYLKKHNYEIYVVPFWKKDVAYCKELSSKAQVTLFKDWKNIQKTLDFMSDAFIVIGEKLHSLVFSAACNVPFVTIEYDPKCFDFSDSVGLNRYVVRTDKLTSEKLIKLFHELEKDRDGAHKKLKKQVMHFRKLQKETVKKIESDIMAIPDKQLSLKNKFFHYIIDGIHKNLLELKYRY